MSDIKTLKRKAPEYIPNKYQEMSNSNEIITQNQTYSSNNTETVGKKKSQKMFECKICQRQYSNIGGIVTHQKNAHGSYDPYTIKKTIHNKTKEGLGRPMQFKIDQQQKNETIDKFLSNVESEYTDRRLEFFLDKNLKFVFNSIMEAGDPIIHKKRANLFITDFKDFEMSDDWLSTSNQPKKESEKDRILNNFIQNTLNSTNIPCYSEVKQVNHCDFFQDDLSCPITAASDELSSNGSNYNTNNNNEENIFFPQKDNNNEIDSNNQIIDQQKCNDYKLRCKEFLKKLLEFQKEDQTEWLVKIFDIIFTSITQQNLQYNEINNIVRQNVKINTLSDSQYSTLINNIVHGIISYIKQTPNYLYSSYFGYQN